LVTAVFGRTLFAFRPALACGHRADGPARPGAKPWPRPQRRSSARLHHSPEFERRSTRAVPDPDLRQGVFVRGATGAPNAGEALPAAVWGLHHDGHSATVAH